MVGERSLSRLRDGPQPEVFRSRTSSQPTEALLHGGNSLHFTRLVTRPTPSSNACFSVGAGICLTTVETLQHITVVQSYVARMHHALAILAHIFDAQVSELDIC